MNCKKNTLALPLIPSSFSSSSSSFLLPPLPSSPFIPFSLSFLQCVSEFPGLRKGRLIIKDLIYSHNILIEPDVKRATETVVKVTLINYYWCYSY